MVFCAAYEPLFILLVIIIMRLYIPMMYVYNDFICYNLFDPSEGIKYTKIFNFGFIVSGLANAIINDFLFDFDNIYKPFYIFLVTSILSFGLHYYQFRFLPKSSLKSNLINE